MDTDLPLGLTFNVLYKRINQTAPSVEYRLPKLILCRRTNAFIFPKNDKYANIWKHIHMVYRKRDLNLPLSFLLQMLACLYVCLSGYGFLLL